MVGDGGMETSARPAVKEDLGTSCRRTWNGFGSVLGCFDKKGGLKRNALKICYCDRAG